MLYWPSADLPASVTESCKSHWQADQLKLAFFLWIRFPLSWFPHLFQLQLFLFFASGSLVVIPSSRHCYSCFPKRFYKAWEMLQHANSLQHHMPVERMKGRWVFMFTASMFRCVLLYHEIHALPGFTQTSFTHDSSKLKYCIKLLAFHTDFRSTTVSSASSLRARMSIWKEPVSWQSHLATHETMVFKRIFQEDDKVISKWLSLSTQRWEIKSPDSSWCVVRLRTLEVKAGGWQVRRPACPQYQDHRSRQNKIAQIVWFPEQAGILTLSSLLPSQPASQSRPLTIDYADSSL